MDGYSERVGEFVRLTNRQEELTDPLRNEQAKELAEIATQLARLEPQLLEDFEQADRQRDHVHGRTVYRKVDVYASCSNIELAQIVFPEHGLGDLVKPAVNGQTLRGWLLTDLMKPLGLKRALGPDGKLVPELAAKLPPEVQEVIRVTQVPRIKISAASS